MNLSNEKSIPHLLRAKTGQTIGKFAKVNHVSRHSVYSAMDGLGSRRIRVKIAIALDIPPSMIWAENDRAKRVADDLDYMDFR